MFREHRGRVNSVQLSPDEETFITAGTVQYIQYKIFPFRGNTVEVAGITEQLLSFKSWKNYDWVLIVSPH